MFYRSSQRI